MASFVSPGCVRLARHSGQRCSRHLLVPSVGNVGYLGWQSNKKDGSRRFFMITCLMKDGLLPVVSN